MKRIYPKIAYLESLARTDKTVRAFRVKIYKSLNTTIMKLITDWFEILDCLGGEITGDYEADSIRAAKFDLSFSQISYDLAYSISENP